MWSVRNECVLIRENVVFFHHLTTEITRQMVDAAFRGGLVFEAHRLLNHSTLGLRGIMKRRRRTFSLLSTSLARRSAYERAMWCSRDRSFLCITIDPVGCVCVGLSVRGCGSEGARV